MRQAHLAWVKETGDLGLIPEPIVHERRRSVGSEYEILRQPGQTAVNARIAETAVMASQGMEVISQLIERTEDADSTVRYWSAIGIGNIGADAKDQADHKIRPMLADPSSAVRTAAARALCRMGSPKEALPVLIEEMKNGAQWERLHAAIVLDEIDEQARPVIEQMRAGLEYTKGFNSNGKYRVRVINRALNELEGTNNVVN